MTKREVVRAVLEGRRPPYVPSDLGFTVPAREKLIAHYGKEGLAKALRNHFVGLGTGIGYMEDIGQDRVRDIFGVVWNRSVDKDIGVIEGRALPEPTLAGYELPDPCAARFYDGIEKTIAANADRFRVFNVGFSLFERAWTLRGMEPLMMDFYENPEFVHDLLRAIADWNIAHVRRALRYDIDAVHFGDDWGAQRGLLMGPDLWREFIKPELARMYAAVRSEGRFVTIHSCGKVDELFDDLVGIGLNCFNPFQPEVMDTAALLAKYRGRLAFHGGMSTQRTLPFATPAEVRAETRRLIELGRPGGLIFAPAHAVPGDAPVENLVAMIEEVAAQVC
jgi:uroporphyrinogen decarboxylase